MDKTFKPAEVEESLYKQWEEKGIFTSQPNKDKTPFTIILPPPNANADLHLGHAMYVYEDIMIRYRKQHGDEVLWLPGADHAGIETQFVFEKHLAKQGKSRFDYDRETLYKMIWDFVHENRGKMENQLRKLGYALDWSKRKFTLDEDVVKIVKETFKQLFDDKLVYRDNRLVNYCTHCGTSFSDLEVKHVEQKDPLYYLKYGPFILATVRPETKFGDTAVAVNPKDKRYKDWIGKEIEVEGLLGLFKVRVIGDDAIDPEFGTGVAKVTPAHDFNDFEMAKRHNLEFKTIIDKTGRMTELAGPYKGLKVKKAREQVAEDMKNKGMLEKVDEDYVHTVANCYKCGRVLEPILMPQWYVKVRPLADRAIKAVEDGEVKFTNKRFEKSAVQWLTNFHDWNISRQNVWGIRIPAYRCVRKSQIANHESQETIHDTRSTKDDPWFVSVGKPDKCQICGECVFEQDTDTFDTWFSSGQWPFATLQSIGKEAFEYYYPTAVMETGYDILPWWVCRMLMFGLYRTGKVPFKAVYLHGLVRVNGQKMSKSKGNVINPLAMIEKYGADALRAALIFEVGDGTDLSISDDKIRSMRNFANKVWNIGRFLEMNKGSGHSDTDKMSGEESGGALPSVAASFDSAQDDEKNTTNDKIKELEKEFESMEKEFHKNMKDYKFSAAFGLMYEFVWHRFADFYIEQLKEELRNDNIEVRDSLTKIYLESLKLLHPFVPFITDAVYKQFTNKFILE
ncbi:MAG: valine--tRNA ligase [Microgenomates group bacterium]